MAQKTWGRLRGLFKRDEAESEPEGDPISEEGSQPEANAEAPSQEGEI